jgi:hypothetical protein
MGISNSKVIKAGVDALTGLLNVVNKLTGNSGIAKLIVAMGALKGGKTIFENLFKTFAPFGKQFEKTGNDVGEGFLKGITQRLNNFKAGRGFVLDVDIDEKGVKNRIDNLKQNFLELKHSLTEKIDVDAIIDFSTTSNSMKTLAVEGAFAGETIEHSFSEVGM